jgi:hypothetical protein
MTLLDLIPLVLRLIGLVGWAERWERSQAAKKQAQAVADTPTTNEEWTDAAKNGDL